jgi:hypothetical protein
LQRLLLRRRQAADHPGIGAGPDVPVLRAHDEPDEGEAEAQGNITVIESDGQVSSPKQTADIEAAITQGVDGIVISPERGRRYGAGAAAGR